MENKAILSFLESKINKDEAISPCLFLGKNDEVVNMNVQQIALEIAKLYKTPSAYIYTLEDNGEKIKISEAKRFLEYSNSKPPYRFQIFIFENISRMTLSTANSCLKLFEEPGKYNLIFLTNKSESGVLDTILSRAITFDLGGANISQKNEFYYSLLDSYVNKNSTEIISYFFRNKLEKDEYLQFLENLILYAKEHFCFLHLLEEIDEDMNLIKQNNVNAKYIVDKFLLKLKD